MWLSSPFWLGDLSAQQSFRCRVVLSLVVIWSRVSPGPLALASPSSDTGSTADPQVVATMIACASPLAACRTYPTSSVLSVGTLCMLSSFCRRLRKLLWARFQFQSALDSQSVCRVALRRANTAAQLCVVRFALVCPRRQHHHRGNFLYRHFASLPLGFAIAVARLAWVSVANIAKSNRMFGHQMRIGTSASTWWSALFATNAQSLHVSMSLDPAP